MQKHTNEKIQDFHQQFQCWKHKDFSKNAEEEQLLELPAIRDEIAAGLVTYHHCGFFLQI